MELKTRIPKQKHLKVEAEKPLNDSMSPNPHPDKDGRKLLVSLLRFRKS